ncbi:DUF4129 domain-containing protein [Aureliella helgolandensis]|uniref:DUF4129 domain-containing protein n=1 Tax=Aureliella helgolandensis TaxID=2527968 RepID=A0A518GGP0_9BACT|nr:DUF4129 domain-containing protein [Aureliella helgolandensis]QDV27718.1 hypothetical protein Q31a_61110 [Aureliella helgolandensis]
MAHWKNGLIALMVSLMLGLLLPRQCAVAQDASGGRPAAELAQRSLELPAGATNDAILQFRMMQHLSALVTQHEAQARSKADQPTSPLEALAPLLKDLNHEQLAALQELMKHAPPIGSSGVDQQAELNSWAKSLAAGELPPGLPPAAAQEAAKALQQPQSTSKLQELLERYQRDRRLPFQPGAGGDDGPQLSSPQLPGSVDGSGAPRSAAESNRIPPVGSSPAGQLPDSKSPSSDSGGSDSLRSNPTIPNPTAPNPTAPNQTAPRSNAESVGGSNPNASSLGLGDLYSRRLQRAKQQLAATSLAPAADDSTANTRPSGLSPLRSPAEPGDARELRPERYPSGSPESANAEVPQSGLSSPAANSAASAEPVATGSAAAPGAGREQILGWLKNLAPQGSTSTVREPAGLPSVPEFLQGVQQDASQLPPLSSLLEAAGIGGLSEALAGAGKGMSQQEVKDAIRALAPEGINRKLDRDGFRKTFRDLLSQAQSESQRGKSGGRDSTGTSDGAFSGFEASLMQALDGVRDDVMDMAKDLKPKRTPSAVPRATNAASSLNAAEHARTGGTKEGGDGPIGGSDSPSTSSTTAGIGSASGSSSAKTSVSSVRKFAQSASEFLKSLAAAPAAPSPSGAGQGSVGMGPSVNSGLRMDLLLLLMLIGLVVLIWYLRRAAAMTPGASNLAPAMHHYEIQTQADIIRVFHALAQRSTSPAERWWTHRRAADAILASRPGTDAALDTLARLYEQARYRPLDQPLAAEQLTQARRAVEQCLA